MIEVSITGEPESPSMHVGLGTQRGFLMWLDRDGGWSAGDSNRDGFVPYDFAGNAQEIPAQAEIPVDIVQTGLREFMRTGRKPVTPTWQ